MQGRHLKGQKYGILKFYTPQLGVLFTVHTNAIVVTIRITIGDLIAGVGRQQRRLLREANTRAPPLCMDKNNASKQQVVYTSVEWLTIIAA